MWTSTQYTLIVLITIAITIPSLSGQSDYVKTLSTALLYIKFRSVENTYSRFGATSIKELLVRYRITQVGLQKILTQPCRRLICHFHAILKHSYWKLNKQKPVQRLKVYLTFQGNSYGKFPRCWVFRNIEAYYKVIACPGRSDSEERSNGKIIPPPPPPFRRHLQQFPMCAAYLSLATFWTHGIGLQSWKKKLNKPADQLSDFDEIYLE